MAEKQVKKCKTTDCINPARQFGVCSSCYSVLRRAVLLGKTTWDEAEDRGLIERERRPCPMHNLVDQLLESKGSVGDAN
jgi:hypothetical protein